MEKYLKENGWSSFFDTYEDGEQISNVQRKQLMNMVADLIIDTFGFYPDLNEKVMVSNGCQLISMFGYKPIEMWGNREYISHSFSFSNRSESSTCTNQFESKCIFQYIDLKSIFN